MRRNIFKQNKRIRLKRKKILIKTGVIVGVVFLLFILTVWGLYNERVRIVNVYTQGNSVVLDREIKEIAKEQLAGKYFGIFPRDSIFLYPKQQIKNKILDIYKRVYYIKVNISNLNSIVVTVKERKSYALWCGDTLIDDKDGITDNCYFIDDKGFVFTKAPLFSDNVYFTVYGEVVGDGTNPLGKNFLGEERFVRLMQLRDLLSKEGLDTEALKQEEGSDFEFYLTSGGKLIFNEKQEMKKLLRNLVAAIEVKKNEGKNIKENLEYIDVRFNNKVLFKFTK
jgi:cell division septal protein FtsQ